MKYVFSKQFIGLELLSWKEKISGKIKIKFFTRFNILCYGTKAIPRTKAKGWKKCF